jgi:hypothetical protein
MQTNPGVTSRLLSTRNRNLGAVLAFVILLGTDKPTLAATTIEELLQQDEASRQNDVPRPDLNVLTEAEWEYYFTVGRQQTELDSQWVERESEKLTHVLDMWVAAIAGGLGMTVSAIGAWPSVRRAVRNLADPVAMEDFGFTIATYSGYEDGSPSQRV